MHYLGNTKWEDDFIERICSNDIEERLAKLSEVENTNMKNRYRHQRKTMQWADPKKMPVDESKVKDLLRHQHLFRDKMNVEIGTYQSLQDNPQMQNGVL